MRSTVIYVHLKVECVERCCKLRLLPFALILVIVLREAADSRVLALIKIYSLSLYLFLIGLFHTSVNLLLV